MATKQELHAAEVEAITKSCPMEYLCSHPFFLIRWIERSRRELLARTIAPKLGETIADIGCERAHLLSLLNKRCPGLKKLYGIDLSRHALGEAKRIAEWEKWASKCELIHGDACDIPLPANSVDAAISSNVLEHLHDPQKGFDELVRITKPGGRIILNLPNEKRIIALKKMFFRLGFRKLLGNLTLITPGHLHYPDKKFVRQVCKGKGIIKKMFLGPRISLLGLYIYAVIEPKK